MVNLKDIAGNAEEGEEDCLWLSDCVWLQTDWVRMDGEPATREHLMMALADLDYLLIRATYTQTTDEVS